MISTKEDGLAKKIKLEVEKHVFDGQKFALSGLIISFCISKQATVESNDFLFVVSVVLKKNTAESCV